MAHEKKLRELAAFLVRNATADVGNLEKFLTSFYGVATGERYLKVFSVSTARVVAHVKFTCGEQQKYINAEITKLDEAGNIAQFFNESVCQRSGSGFENIFNGSEQVKASEIIYKGKRPVIVVSYEKEVDKQTFKNLSRVRQFKFPTEESYQAELLLSENEHDDLTRPLTADEIGAQPIQEQIATYFQNNLDALKLSDEEIKYFFEGVLAKSLLGKLPHYSLRNRYNIGKQYEAVFGAFSVTHGIVNSDDLLFLQVRELDGMLGHFGGFGRLDPSYKNEETGEIIHAAPEQPAITVNRETNEEIPGFGKVLENSNLELVNASIFPRRGGASDIAFGYDRTVSEAVMKEVITHISATRLSKKRGDELKHGTVGEVHSFLAMPISIALTLKEHFQYPHEFKAIEIVADQRGIKPVVISECAKNTLVGIAESDSKLKTLSFIAERLALEKVIEAIAFGSSSKEIEAEYSNAIEKYGRAVLSLINPNKYDINTNLTAIHEIEDYMANKLPDKLAKKLKLEEFKKKACFNEIIAAYEASDIVYARLPQEELLALAARLKEAADLYHISYLTQETTKPERVFLHAVMQMVGVKCGIKGIFEHERGVNFEAKVMPIYEAHLAEYEGMIKDQEANLRDQLEFFNSKLRNFENWQEDGLKFPFDEALKMYRLGEKKILENRFEEEYEGELEDLIRKWVKLKIEHKHHLDAAYQLLEEKMVGLESALIPRDNSERISLMVTGGMASGKTTLTKKFLEQKAIREDSVVINDPDPSKRTLAHAALNDGIITKSLDDPNHNWGARAHPESANSRFEETQLLARLAKENKCPNVVINMLSPGIFEIEMAIKGGANLHVEILTVRIDQAWVDLNKRANQPGYQGTNRLPPQADFRQSHKNANMSLLRLLPYKGHKITANLRERIDTNIDGIYAQYNAADNSLIIHDIITFNRMAERAFQSRNAGKDAENYFSKLVEADVKITFAECEKDNASSKVAAYFKNWIEKKKTIKPIIPTESYSALPIHARIVKEAGDVILAMQDDVIKNHKWHYKEDGSKVSDADYAANDIINARSKQYFPNVAIVSEENTAEENAVALQADEQWQTDPLDNTGGYLDGLDGFSVNYGRTKNGIPVAGAIYFPKRKELYFTGDDGKAYLQIGDNAPKELKVKTGVLRDPIQVAVGFTEQNTPHLEGRNFETKQHAAQSRTCAIIKGECDISGINSAGFNSWDIAGPHAVLLAAGGEIMGLDKQPIRYKKCEHKIPAHIVGSIDALVVIGVAEPSLAKTSMTFGK